MNGWEVIRRLKDSQKLKDIPIIIITARNDDIIKKAGEFYADDLIEKPFITNDLKRRIDNLLYPKK